MKRILVVILLFSCLVFRPFQALNHTKPATGFSIKTIVIDAGHGGHDSGCLGSFAKEKNVTLSVALKVGALLEKNFPDVKVIYTRKTDEFIELYERASIANRNKADLFVSIHCNANSNKTAYGTESWVMGLHKTDANLDVAKRENSVILLENNYAQNYDGFDPNSPESYIMFSLNQNAYLNQSLNVAAKVENEFRKIGRTSRGVKQAGYLVLWRTTMPSLLIETGFLTNNSEEKFLASIDGQNKIALSVFEAIAKYKSEVEGIQLPEMKPDEEVKKNTTTVTSPTKGKTEGQNPKVNLQPEPEKEQKTVTDPNQIIYKIQIAAGSHKAAANDAKYKGLKDLTYEQNEKGLYRYMVGSYTDQSEAENRLEKLKEQGFKTAFIAAYKNGVRTR